MPILGGGVPLRCKAARQQSAADARPDLTIEGDLTTPTAPFAALALGQPRLEDQRGRRVGRGPVVGEAQLDDARQYGQPGILRDNFADRSLREDAAVSQRARQIVRTDGFRQRLRSHARAPVRAAPRTSTGGADEARLRAASAVGKGRRRLVSLRAWRRPRAVRRRSHPAARGPLE